MTTETTISVKWLDHKQNYLLWTFGERWTMEDYFESLSKVWNSIDSKEAPTQLMIDLRKSIEHPSNVTTLMRSAFRKNGCTLAQVAVITQHNFWERVFSIVKKTDKTARSVPVKFVDSFEAATEYFSNNSE